MRASAARTASGPKERARSFWARLRRVCAAREMRPRAGARARRSPSGPGGPRCVPRRVDCPAAIFPCAAKTSAWSEKKEPSERWIRTISPAAPLSSIETIERAGSGGLALGELEAASGTGLAVLLPLHHPRVPREEPVGAQGGVVRRVVRVERPGDAVPACLDLARKCRRP